MGNWPIINTITFYVVPHIIPILLASNHLNPSHFLLKSLLLHKAVMAISSGIYLLFLLNFFSFGTIFSSATSFTLENRCSFTVWPGSLTANGPPLGDGGFVLAPGSSSRLQPPPGWSGRFWGRTGCNFDNSGSGKCVTGDCGGALKCNGGGIPPVSLIEFTLNGHDNKDFYDISLVDGYNMAVAVKAVGGTGTCQYAGCVNDLNTNCPAELQMMDSGSVVACKSACAAFNMPEYCCTGAHGTPQTCSPTKYSQLFKNACPTAYSYAYDDATSTMTCTGADYLITFCPTS